MAQAANADTNIVANIIRRMTMILATSVGKMIFTVLLGSGDSIAPVVAGATSLPSMFRKTPGRARYAQHENANAFVIA
jgi:hypothetical protein